LKYIASIVPHQIAKTIINAINSRLRGFIGTGSRHGPSGDA